MTAPRQILPGASYLVTRRCTQRQFLLRPSARVNELFLFVLAVAAQRHGILVHAFCVLSNHYHLVVTDPDARLPRFQQYLDALVARAMNASLGRSEHFWGSNTYSAVRLETPADIVEEAAYTLANPVAAGLVRTGGLWPGLRSDPRRIGAEPLVVSRPEHFFARDGALPPNATLQLTAPPGFASDHEFIEQVTRAVDRHERDARERIGPHFLGVARVLAQSPTARPTSREPRGGLNPRVAAKDTRTRIEALARLKQFLKDYRDAWEAWRQRKPGVLFPAGTYLLRVVHAVPCHGFG